MSGASVRTTFPAYHRFDRRMIAVTVAIVWCAIVTGFGLDLVKRAQHGTLSFPLIIHLHAVAYSSWLLLLAAQVWLMRTGRAAVHRQLGRAALVLLPLMLVLGPAAAIANIESHPQITNDWISFTSVQFTNTFGCVVLLATGLMMRGNPAAHKRLMLMGTIAVTEPGFSRIWAGFLSARLGDGYLPFYFSTYIGTLVLIIAVGAYDFATRRRLHPAYVGAALFILANETLATWLYYQPFWLTWMSALTRHTA